MRCAVDLGGGAVGPERGGCVACEGRGGRAGGAAAEPVAGEGAGAGVHPAARISGRSGGGRGIVVGGENLPEPESLSGGDTAEREGGGKAGGGGDFLVETGLFLPARQ